MSIIIVSGRRPRNLTLEQLEERLSDIALYLVMVSCVVRPTVTFRTRGRPILSAMVALLPVSIAVDEV